jgi:hypothetical protein
MPKLRSISVAIVLSFCGFGWSQTAIATINQTQSLVIKQSVDLHSERGDVRTVALAKKCTIRCYRRPR